MPLALHQRCLLFAACIFTTNLAVAQARLPTAPVRGGSEAMDGARADDGYRELENTQAPAVAAWMKAHSDHAHALLRSISGRDALRDKLDRYESAAAPRIAELVRLPGEIYFYQRRGAAEDHFKLVMRQGLQGRESVVFDPVALSKRPAGQQPLARLARAHSAYHAPYRAMPSPDGRWVVVVAAQAVVGGVGGLSAVGRGSVLRVLDTRTSRQVGGDVDAALQGGVSWLPDSSGFFFRRLQPATPPGPGGSTAFMKPGGSEASIRTVVRAGVDLGLAPTDSPFIDVQPDGRALLVAAGDTEPEALKLWHSTAAAVLAGKPDWKPLANREDKVTAVALQGEHFYALTQAGAPRFKVVGGRLDAHTAATAPTLLPESERLLTGLTVASDALYVAALEGNQVQLLRRQHRDDAVAVELPLPALGRFTLGTGPARADLPGVLLHLHSWTRAPQVFLLGADGRFAATGLQASGPYDAPGDLLSSEVQVAGATGAPLPLTLVHKADVQPDGSNPVLLLAHTRADTIDEPVFSASRLAWLEAGGVLAVAHRRVGDSVGLPDASALQNGRPSEAGVQAPQAPQAPQQELAPKASESAAARSGNAQDLIACAEWLVSNRWTTASRLALWAAGADGGRAALVLQERPALFAAVVLESAALGAWRGPGLQAAPTASAAEGVKHPAVLLTHAVGDRRVPVWHTTQTAARLMAAWGGGKPVLMRLDADTGLAAATAPSREWDAQADRLSFVLWQLGVPGFHRARQP